MKYARTLGMLMVLVAALSAVTASSAAASAKVCSTSGTGGACKAGHGKEYTGPIKVTLEAGTSTLGQATNSSGSAVTQVTCTSSTLSGEVTNAATGTGKVTGMTFAGCTSAVCSQGITITPGGFPWSATATTLTPGIEAEKALLDATNSTTKVVCGTFAGPVTCEYTASTNSVQFTAGEPAKGEVINMSAAKTAGPEAICGVKEDLSGKYTTTTPTSLFIE
jgi:hypothetical protein